MDDAKYFKEFNTRSLAVSAQWKKAINQPWVRYHGFEGTSLPPRIWEREKILRAVDKEFKFDKVGVIRLPPYFNYAWHQDTNRGCSINMLLSHDHSHTLFMTGTARDYDVYFTELKYQPHTFYAFNSQEHHCVFNFKETRYLFTCEFVQDKYILPYKTLCDWVTNYENN